MTSWEEYEKQFKELSLSLRNSRLDIQWGDSGEHFRIAGSDNKLALQRFEILARKAGDKLNNIKHIQNYPDIHNENDTLRKWYKALWKLGDNLEEHSFGVMKDKDNNEIGYIYFGTINEFVEVSAILCLKFSTNDDEEKFKKDIQSRSPLTLDGLHPRIIKISKELFEDGYYRQAVLDSYIDLVSRVKQLSNVYDRDGSNLMQYVFSQNNPKIKLSDNSDEQVGFMWLFCGAVMGIRNPKAHKVSLVRDPKRSLEWLAFASVLHRVLDDIDNTNEDLL